MTDLSKYAYCEPACVATAAPWCIRPLTVAGLKLSGAVDTDSLCVRVTVRMNGWDINRRPEAADLDATVERRTYDRRTIFVPLVCQKCVELLRKREAGEGT